MSEIDRTRGGAAFFNGRASRDAELAAKDKEIAELKADLPYVIGFNAGWDEAMKQVIAEARRYAAMYPSASDGRNTFTLFAEWAERTTRAALTEEQG